MIGELMSDVVTLLNMRAGRVRSTMPPILYLLPACCGLL